MMVGYADDHAGDVHHMWSEDKNSINVTRDVICMYSPVPQNTAGESHEALESNAVLAVQVSPTIADFLQPGDTAPETVPVDTDPQATNTTNKNKENLETDGDSPGERGRRKGDARGVERKCTFTSSL
jgi:hypothetical protein